MDRNSARKLVKETFQNPFDKNKFLYFVKNLVNSIDESNVFHAHGDVPEMFKEYIKTYERLGTYTDYDHKKLDILIVYLKKETSLGRARTAQRNFVARYLKDQGEKEGGLIAFVSPNIDDWRFSFVKMEYKFVENEKGIVKAKELFTPARRYSFLVGNNENSHTAQSSLMPLLEEEMTCSVAVIEGAFSIEKVTKEFYEKYRNLYENLSKALSKDKSFQIFSSKANLNISEFSKKVLGQIVFLYFIQKKGWLGVPKGKTWGEGDKKFLRNLFNDCAKNNKNFYNDYLEYLFYDTLNNQDRGGADPSYSKKFDCKIPFLNGGLFEEGYEWRDSKGSFVIIDNKLFSENAETGNGILDIFDRYNFTVKEDEPLEKEVAVDPEMLGKVFENLLEENLRKGQGAYYTPREIVHYMCQESLVNYLTTETSVDIDILHNIVKAKDNMLLEEEKELKLQKNQAEEIERALVNIKTCDPACGSGAFLVGMLNEIIGLRRVITPYLVIAQDKETQRTEYVFKKETIQNCIYGVDIDPGAVDIAKLRLWLSLVVDYQLEEIEPLPNLDYKIMCGNSLLEELVLGDESIQLIDEKVVITNKGCNKDAERQNKEIQDKLESKRKELINKHSNGTLTISKKSEIDKEIKALEKKLNPKKKKSKYDYHPSLFEEKADKYLEMLRALHKEYFIEINPHRKKEKKIQIENIELEFIKSSTKERVDEIDSKINNLNMQIPEDRKRNAEYMKKKLDYLSIPKGIHRSKVEPYFLWKLNFFEVFLEKGGFDIAIANPPYLKERDNKQTFSVINKSDFGKKYHQGKMDYWYYFLHKAIDVIKPDGVVSYITSRYWLNSSGAKKLIQRVKKELNFVNFVDIGKLKVFDTVAGHHMIAVYCKNQTVKDFQYKKLKNTLEDINKDHDTVNLTIEVLKNTDILSLETDEIILGKDVFVFNGVVPLGDIADISQGVVEAPDRLSKKQYNMSARRDVNVGDGIFVVSKNELSKLDFNKEEMRIMKKYIDPHDVYKYGKRDASKYLIYSDKNSKINIETDIKFQGIKKHLDRYKEFISSSNAPYGLHRSRDIRYFTNPKIIFKNMFVSNEFALDYEGHFFGFSFSSVIKKDSHYDLKYILAILNSALALKWFYFKGKKRGAGVDIGVDKLRMFPIKQISLEAQAQYVKLVDEVISLIHSVIKPIDCAGLQEKIQPIVDKIDKMVYELYGVDKADLKDISCK